MAREDPGQVLKSNVPPPSNLIQGPPLSDTDHDEEEDNSIDLHLGGLFASKGQLTCHECHSPDCEDGVFHLCHKAVKCFTSHVREVDGTERKTKGKCH